MADKVKGRSPKKLKILILVPYVWHGDVHVFTFNVVLPSFTERGPGTGYSIRRNFGRSGKGSFNEKAKIVDGHSVCSTPEGTGSKLQYEPDLFSVGHSKTE